MRGRRSFALLFTAVLALAAGTAAMSPDEMTAAQRLVFATPHLDGLKAGTVLHYGLERVAGDGSGFSDTVDLRIVSVAADQGKSLTVAFGTGARRLPFPPVDGFRGNPVVMFALERDVRQMAKDTGGQPLYFQNLIRFAFADVAEARPVEAECGGAKVAAQEIRFQPFVGDENSSRFKAFEAKAYTFVMSDAVPGQLCRLETSVPGAGADAPQTVETLRYLGMDAS